MPMNGGLHIHFIVNPYFHIITLGHIEGRPGNVPVDGHCLDFLTREIHWFQLNGEIVFHCFCFSCNIKKEKQ